MSNVLSYQSCASFLKLATKTGLWFLAKNSESKWGKWTWYTVVWLIWLPLSCITIAYKTTLSGAVHITTIAAFFTFFSGSKHQDERTFKRHCTLSNIFLTSKIFAHKVAEDSDQVIIEPWTSSLRAASLIFNMQKQSLQNNEKAF